MEQTRSPQSEALLARIRSGDASVARELEASGMPKHLVRALIAAVVAEQYRGRIEALRPDLNTIPPWASRKEMDRWYAALRGRYKVEQEQKDWIRANFGPEYVMKDARAELRMYPLPPEKAERISALEQDHQAMLEELGRMYDRVRLPEDEERIAFLQKEYEAEIDAILTPEEALEYRLRHSTTAALMRSNLSAFEPTEAEFRALFAINSRIDAAAGTIMSSTYAEKRNQLTRDAEEEIKAVLGESRFAEYKRAQQFDYRQLHKIAAAHKLPPTAAVEAHQAVTALEQQFRTRPAQNTPEARREHFAQLAKVAEERLKAILGPAGFEDFRENSSLFRRLSTPLPTANRP
jgi:hypothetical protein